MSADTEEGRAEEAREYAEALDAAADYIAQFLVNPELRVTPASDRGHCHGHEAPAVPVGLRPLP